MCVHVPHLCTIMALLSKLGHIYLKPYSLTAGTGGVVSNSSRRSRGERGVEVERDRERERGVGVEVGV